MLFYATGGLAWTNNQFRRTQVLGIPAGGAATPGTVEAQSVTRVGWVAGAGVEYAINNKWTTRVEYLLTDFGSRSMTFPAAAQTIDSNLVAHSARLGFNYRLDGDTGKKVLTTGFPSLELDRFSLQGQTTFLQQYAFRFRAPYRGPNSLDPNQGRQTWDVTFYAGMRLWDGAELWVNPEIDQGFGLSSTLGVAGFPSGEAYKIGSTYPYARIPRAFLRQTIDLGGAQEKVKADINQFSGSQATDRFVITVGKFSVSDIFDTLGYSHDPRGDFMNWALVDAGTFDYAADAWGYTYGAAVEWYRGPWTLRGGLFDLSVVPNSTDLDPQFRQFQWVGEIEYRQEWRGQPGKILLTGFLSRGRMGRFDDALRLAQITGGPADISVVRRYTSRGGINISAEQQLMPGIGIFGRAGIANGQVETYEFSDIDRTVAGGFSFSGKLWGRPDDTLGIAGIVNNISGDRRAFLNAGGLGILVGDGQLPHPGAEKILETYYSLPFFSARLSFDYQFIANPAYNRDRGPVSVLGLRLRSGF